MGGWQEWSCHRKPMTGGCKSDALVMGTERKHNRKKTRGQRFKERWRPEESPEGDTRQPAKVGFGGAWRMIGSHLFSSPSSVFLWTLWQNRHPPRGRGETHKVQLGGGMQIRKVGTFRVSKYYRLHVRYQHLCSINGLTFQFHGLKRDAFEQPGILPRLRFGVSARYRRKSRVWTKQKLTLLIAHCLIFFHSLLY